MGGGLVEGAVLGAAVQEVMQGGAKPVAGLVSKALKFEATRRELRGVLRRVTPVVQEMKRLNAELDLPEEETKLLLEDLQKGEKLCRKHSNVPWWRWCCLPCYQGELQEADEAVVRSLTLCMPPVIARDVKRTLSTVRNIQGSGRQFMGLCKAPEKPDRTVGLDILSNKLKKQLLESGASVSVLTGLAGSGKTTLATLLCWDRDVRGKFGENILFVTVSKTPNLKTIVQTLFQHRGRHVPRLVSDGHAVRQLKILLQEIGKSPMMLVLDDVWPGSESLVEAFQVQLPDYKVLVTSRVEFPRFKTSCPLEPLCDKDALTLFCHFADTPDPDDFVERVARGCWGLPLALEVIGRSLRGQPTVVWQKMEEELSNGHSIFDSDTDLLNIFQKCLDDVLEDKPIIKDCFMDLGLFPEDHKIPVAALIDMWIELYEQVNDDIDAMINVHEFTNRHLAKLVNRRKVAMDADMYYNNHFLTLHDLLRDLAIHQSNQETFEQRKRLIIDLSGNNRPEWWEGQNQQGIISRMLSFLPIGWTEHKQKQVDARTLSISTDEAFTSDWCNIQPDEAEVLVLNIRSSKYTLPEFTKKMSKLKVLIVTNYGFHPSELNKFELLGYLPDLKRIRLEKVSVPCLCKLKSLQKLSLYMCNTRQAFESSSVQISDALPNLVEMNIDYCNDLVELPSELCKITTLKKLSITNCHRLSALPQDIGQLENLEVLRLSSCSDLREMPKFVRRPRKLRCLDISDCVSLTQLPEDIGGLHSLEKLYMWGCSRLRELPYSVVKFEDLKHVISVICDEEVAALWKNFTNLPNVKIEMSKADISLNWLTGVRS